MTYKAYYYLKPSGRAPLAEYLKEFKDKRTIAVIFKFIVRLISSECQLPSNFVKPVVEKIYELRICYHGNHYRIFYFIRERGKVILLDGYTKKTNKIPSRILKRVQNYYFDYLTHQYEKEFKEKEIVIA
ncbi:MAG: type II toxin-antitoxin system RelE/ParE family toxin [Candidatus Peregrinibacteria bacterium]